MLQRTSSGSVKIISIDRNSVLAWLGNAARRIYAERPDVVQVRVFGSLARGDQVGTSDVDVLILLREGDVQDPLEQVRAFSSYFDLPIGVDLLVYTQAQLTRQLAIGDAFVQRMWQESLVL